jgi:hypothetical protein
LADEKGCGTFACQAGSSSRNARERNPVTLLNEANQRVTAAMTFAFAVTMLASARVFIEPGSADNISRPVIVASLPL